MDINYFLLISVFAIGLAYFFGIIIVNVVDKKLAQIEIRLPESFTNHPDSQPLELKSPSPDPNEPLAHSEKPAFSKIRGEDTWERFIPKTCCFLNHDHNRNGSCGYGPTNYSDPRGMKKVDQDFHKRHYNPERMTIQDYVDWLWLHLSDDENLPYEHSKNLRKLREGKELEPLPGVLPPPKDCMPTSYGTSSGNCFGFDNQDNYIKAYNYDDETFE